MAPEDNLNKLEPIYFRHELAVTYKVDSCVLDRIPVMSYTYFTWPV